MRRWAVAVAVGTRWMQGRNEAMYVAGAQVAVGDGWMLSRPRFNSLLVVRKDGRAQQ